MPLVARSDGIDEPETLRRADGSSVYTVAGTTSYTSQRILQAEQRLVAAAGHRDGSIVDPSAVELALLELAANGTTLDTGQAALGSRDVHLRRTACNWRSRRLAPARRLPCAPSPWPGPKTAAQVIGLAPSAAAAAVLGEQTGIRTDTLAKLTWSIEHDDLPDWTTNIGPSTLVIIDEAGMADTLSLYTAVRFAIDRGASVRLIGDDQQLAAIGAGGILRDIKHTHGAPATHRTPPLQQTQPKLEPHSPSAKVTRKLLASISNTAASTSATSPSPPTMRSSHGSPTERPDSTRIMVAPTRELVADLNRRAREHRLLHARPGGEVSARRREPGLRRRHDHHPHQ